MELMPVTPLFTHLRRSRIIIKIPKLEL